MYAKKISENKKKSIYIYIKPRVVGGDYAKERKKMKMSGQINKQRINCEGNGEYYIMLSA